jgi:3-oxoadipate enol-lactonase
MPVADLGGVSLNYELTGDASRPVIVLVNSIGSNLHMWEKLCPALAERYTVLRYDARGHGLSSVPPAPYTIAELAGDLLGLLDHLKLDQVHLCGLSVGGMVGMWMGLHEPRRIQCLILANTAARIGTREGWTDRINAVRQQGMVPIAKATLGRWFTPRFQNDHPSEMDAIRSMLEKTPVEGYVGHCYALADADFRKEIAGIRARCLVIAGTHDPATTPDDARALHAALANSEYVELDASHLSAWERPNEFQNAVLHFVAEEERKHG